MWIRILFGMAVVWLRIRIGMMVVRIASAVNLQLRTTQALLPAQDSLSVSSMEIKHIQVCLREAITEDDDWNNPFYMYKYFVLC